MTATVRVRLFARARELAGADILEVRLPGDATVADVRRALADARPPLAGLLAKSAVAVNEELAADAVPVRAGDTVAVVPPVSGG